MFLTKYISGLLDLITKFSYIQSYITINSELINKIQPVVMSSESAKRISYISITIIEVTVLLFIISQS